MYQALTNRLREALAAHIRDKYGLELAIVVERPPKIEMGEAASPVCFELAKKLKKAPRAIAQEIAASLGQVPGIARVEVAGGGYLNAYFDRGAFWTAVNHEKLEPHQFVEQVTRATLGRRYLGEPSKGREKIIVEHTSINPNKAAHIGHVRNAVLGDTMARILQYAGHRVQVQNYIDNTGVQVADVVIGLLQMEGFTPVWVRNRAREPKFDYYCWDLYARATSFFAEDPERAAKLRGETLKAIEENRGEDAEVAQIVADTMVSCHLKTMARLEIHYELLARESEILHLKFWDAAFEMLKDSGAIQLATSGKLAGCWIMPWGEGEMEEQWATKDEAEAHAKVIVRSNGTVTYVGKDIAYQLWKFGLLGKDFFYKKWPDCPEGRTVWATTSSKGDPSAPNFGESAKTVYNVIDARQTYLQKVVTAGLSALGHEEEAKQSIHLSYEIVSLTPQCAAELGYSDELEKPGLPTSSGEPPVKMSDSIAPQAGTGLAPPTNLRARAVQVSGRKGIGVKADDLMDKLEEATLKEVQQRHKEMGVWAQQATAHAIAVGALRFFLLKFTRNTVIAFDFKDALSFEGETGPYCQYAVVRARGIWRKGAERSPDMTSEANVAEAARILEMASGERAQKFLDGPDKNDLWELVLSAGSLDYAVDAAIATQEPSFVAKYAFQLAQAFNLFYHKHHILSEADEQKRAFLLRLTELVERQLVRALRLLGIEAPEKM